MRRPRHESSGAPLADAHRAWCVGQAQAVSSRRPLQAEEVRHLLEREKLHRVSFRVMSRHFLDTDTVPVVRAGAIAAVDAEELLHGY